MTRLDQLEADRRDLNSDVANSRESDARPRTSASATEDDPEDSPPA